MLRQFGKTRRAFFEEVDLANMKPLQAEPWVHAQRKRCRVGLDDHIALARQLCTVPERFARQEEKICFTTRTFEVFLASERILVDWFATPSGLHKVERRAKRPSGVKWNLLDPQQIADTPPLQELQRIQGIA